MPHDQTTVDERLAAFTYEQTKSGMVFIAWGGRTVMTLKGADAQRFLARVAPLAPREQQLAMAKLTGNFRRGNERAAKRKRDS